MDSTIGKSLSGGKPHTKENVGYRIRIVGRCCHCSAHTRRHKCWGNYRTVRCILLRGGAHTSTKSLASTEAPLTILFYMCLIQLPIGLILSWQVWKTPSALESAWLLLVALSALSAHYCLTKAMKNAEVTLVMILDFFRLPAIAVVGILLYDEPLTPALIIGGVVMLFGNLLVTYKSNRRNQ